MNYQTINKHWRRFWQAHWLWLTLVAIFVLQNHLFNLWLGIGTRAYFVRRSVAAAAFAVLLFGPAALLKKKFQYLYLLLASLIAALILISQFLYYSYSGGFLQASALFYFSQGAAVTGTIKAALSYHLLAFAVGPLLIIFVWLKSRQQKLITLILSGKEKIFALILIIVLTAGGISYPFVRERMESGDATALYRYNKIYDVNKLVSKLGVVNFSVGGLLSLAFGADKVTAADIEFVKNFQTQRATSTAATDFGKLTGRNLIIIQVESLENAVINQKIYGQEISPNLNKLSKQGLYFDNYYAPIGPGSTADAEFMTMNSLYSLPNTVAFIQYAHDNFTALPALLKNNGYHTYSFHGDVPSFWNRANIYPRLGYETWFGRDDYTIPRKIGAFDLADQDFFQQTLPRLKTLPQPFMASLITLTSHTPYLLPDDLLTLKYPATTTLDWLQQQYLQSIRYTDQAIGDFIEQLKTAGLYDNSLIAIVGDHSSFTGISEFIGQKNSPFSLLQSSQVPLILLAPGSGLQGEKSEPAGHLDFYPTLASLLGLKAPANVFGHDLLTADDHAVVSRNLIAGAVISIITDNLAYHASADGVFAHGVCLSQPTGKKLPANDCQTLYEKKQAEVKASDLMVKGDLIQ